MTVNSRNVNDDRLGPTYHGLETVVTKRYASGFALLAGYTYGRTTVEQTSLASPNALINAQGPPDGRRHLFKSTASYIFPYEITFGANLRLQSGRPITRTLAIAACTTAAPTNCLSSATTINAEPRGSEELPATLHGRPSSGTDFPRESTDRRALDGRLQPDEREHDRSTCRTGTGETPIRVAGDPNVAADAIATFLSPTGVLGPRIIRFNLTYWFGGR